MASLWELMAAREDMQMQAMNEKQAQLAENQRQRDLQSGLRAAVANRPLQTTFAPPQQPQPSTLSGLAPSFQADPSLTEITGRGGMSPEQATYGYLRENSPLDAADYAGKIMQQAHTMAQTGDHRGAVDFVNRSLGTNLEYQGSKGELLQVKNDDGTVLLYNTATGEEKIIGTPKQRAPVSVSSGTTLLDPVTLQPVYTPPAQPDYKQRERIAGNRTIFETSTDGGKTWTQVSEGPRYKPVTTGGGGSGSRPSGHGGGMGITMNGLNQQQRDALTAAIGEGRLDPYKINSKNQQILADAAVANPGINLNDMAANLGLARNKDVQMKGAIAETVPPLLKSITENGKKLNYSDNQFIGMAQQWIDKRTNNPQLVKYMTLRNDQLLTLGGIMRSNGMTDMAQRLEEEAAHPTMSPRALDSWLEGQMESVEPRLKMYRSIREGKGAPREGHSSGNKLSAGASFIRDQYTAYGKAGLTEEARQQRILQKMKQRGWSKEQIGAAWLEYKGQ